MKWSITIEKVDNGYIVQPHDEESNINVFEIKEDDLKSEMKTMQDVLYHLKEYFAVYNDKHKGLYLNIDVEDTNEKK